MSLLTPFAEAVAALPLQAPGGQQPQSVSSDKDQPPNPGSQAENPASNVNHSGSAYPDNPNPAQPRAPDQGGQPAASQSGPEQQQSDSQKPVGTAAAPYEKTTGVTASRPAGAAIAPAKQRRARSFLIKVGVVVGAAVAVGTVVALSHGSPSRP